MTATSRRSTRAWLGPLLVDRRSCRGPRRPDRWVWRCPIRTDGHAVQIALVQGNVPHAGTQFLGRAEEVLNNHVAETAVLSAKIATGQLPAPQLVIWPENASDVDPFENARAYTEIQDAAVSVGVPILVGAVLQDGPSARQQHRHRVGPDQRSWPALHQAPSRAVRRVHPVARVHRSPHEPDLARARELRAGALRRHA